MRKTHIVSLLLLFIFFVAGCEKDDICDANTPTTPRLIIAFYDINNPAVLKNVNNLKVIGEGMTQGIIFNGATDDYKYLTNGNTISVPLKTDVNSTSYNFILNSGSANSTLTDTDKVTFNYTRNDIFVSRACGFKTLFNLNQNNPFVHTSIPATKGKWMQYISVEKNNIANEDETHIKIFF